MAQVVKLKRTSVQGRIPTISNLELGELAINTHDGRIFFEKDDGTLSIQEILTTNSQNSGSFNLIGAISASSLSISGDTTIGGNLTLGGNITIGDATTDSVNVTAQFSGSLIPDGNEVYDLGSSLKKWNNTYTKNLIATNITATSFTGSIAATNGIISGSSQLTSSFDSRYLNVTGEGNISGSFTGSFNGDGSGLTGLSVEQVATVTSSFDNLSSISVNHSFDSKNVIISVYDTNYSQIIPQSVTLTDNNTVDIVLSDTGSGHVVLAKGGHVVSGSRIQINEIAAIDDTFTNETSYTVNHSFETKNVFVSVYGINDEQIIPATIATPTTSSVQLGFDNPTSGRVVIGKAGHVVTGTTEGSGTSDFTELTNIPSGLVSGSSQVEFNSVSNTPFSQSATEVTTTKSIVPSTSTIDLGTITNPFRDLYLSDASLYIDGQQVISSAADTLTITTDVGQSIKLLETGADDIILQTEDGNIELKGTIEIQTGKKIIDSSGAKILFGDTLGITGSIDLTGTVDGVDISQFKTDFDTLEGKTLISSSQQITNGSGIVSGSVLRTLDGTGVISGSVLRTLDGTDVVSGSVLRPTGDNVVSSSSQIDLTQTTNYESGIKTKLNTEEVLSGSTISGNKTFNNDLTVAGNLTVQGTTTTIDTTTLNIADNIIELNYGGSATIAGIYAKDPTAPNTISGSLLWDSTNDYWIAGQSGSESKVLVKNGDGVVSGSSQVSFNGITDKPTLLSGSSQVSYSGLSNIPSGIVSGSSQVVYTSLSSIPSGIVSGSSQITYSGISSIPSGIVSGSSQVDYNSIQNKPTIPTNNNQLTNGAGYTTFTANQSVDTTSTVTFSTLTAGTITETSTLRFKENIQEDLDSSIIDKLKPVSFDWKKDGKKDYGFIAEEVDEIDSTLTTRDDNEELTGIKYTKLIPLLVKKIQELEERIKQFENGNS